MLRLLTIPIAILVLLGHTVPAVTPAATAAQGATPAPAPGIVNAVSPVALYDALLTTPIPDALLPAGVALLEPYEWRDTNDPDLAGAIGGVIFADGDPFGSSLPTAIAYVVYPDPSGPRAPLATAARFGVPVELDTGDQVVPAVAVETEEIVGLFTAIDNVFVYAMVPAAGGSAAAAEALARAAITHLHELAASGAATPPLATPVGSGVESLLLRLAAAPFPDADLPFAVGELAILPMTLTNDEVASGAIGALLVRDTDRVYPYPLVTYRFFRDETAALDFVSATVRAAGMSAVAQLPPAIEIPYPTTLLDGRDGGSTAIVQVGATIVIGNAPVGDVEDRHLTAMRLAQIAVGHLERVLGGR